MFDADVVGRAIKKCREKRRLSQEVLSGLAGMYKSHLGRIERGERKANLDSICKISDALGMKPHELVKYIEEEQERSDSAKG